MRPVDRWVIVAGVLLVAAGGGGLAYAWYSTHAPSGGCPSTSNGGNTPLGTALALGAPKESREGGHYWYNFSVQSAGGGLVLDNLNFEVQTATGLNVTTSGFALAVLGPSSTPVANYTMTTGNWSSGGGTLLTSLQTVSLESPRSLGGDTFIVVLNAACQMGSITLSIP